MTLEYNKILFLSFFLKSPKFKVILEGIRREKNMTKFAFLSDFHLQENPESAFYDLNCDETLKGVISQIQKDSVDFVICGGDLAHDPTTPSPYQRLRSLMEQSGLKAHYILGNHDRIDPFLEVYPELDAHRHENKLYYTQEMDKYLFIFLDTTLPNSAKGEIGKEQLDWLQDQLSSNPKVPKVICLHHPIIPTGVKRMDIKYPLLDADKLLNIVLAAKNIKTIVFGHQHCATDNFINGIRILGSPSTCYQLTKGENYERASLPPGYLSYADSWASKNAPTS